MLAKKTSNAFLTALINLLMLNTVVIIIIGHVMLNLTLSKIHKCCRSIATFTLLHVADAFIQIDLYKKPLLIMLINATSL